MRYHKTAISIADQIALLKSRGLIIKDDALATHFLENISYYRLEGYWWALQSDKENHIFKEEADFQTAVDLYNFDRELRLLVFNMVERIEIGIRTRLIYHLSMDESPWWFEDFNLFKHQRHWEKNIESLRREVSRSNEVFIKVHHKKYRGDRRNPPSWKTFEVISLGLLSKFFASLQDNHPSKKKISKSLAVGSSVYLESWLHTITMIRNICAHHSRLWNRNLPTPPKLLKTAVLPWIDDHKAINPNSFYASFICMFYLLQTISPDNQFKKRLKDLLNRYPNIDIKAMGFPENWESQDMFKNDL